MAERRMFAKSIIDTDSFIDMPATARLLYFDLAMRADDDGFVDSQNKIMRMTGATKDDLNILIDNHFIIPFDSGILAIVHWRIHNYIRSDRYTPTLYQTEMGRLKLQENKVYSLSDTIGIPTVYQEGAQVRLDKVSEDKVSVVQADTTPTPEEVESYYKLCCADFSCEYDPTFTTRFFNYPVPKNWQARVKEWVEENAKRPPQCHKQKSMQNFSPSNENWDDLAYQIMDKENGRIDSS